MTTVRRKIPLPFLPCATSAAVGKSFAATSEREAAVEGCFVLPHTGLLDGTEKLLDPVSLQGPVGGAGCCGVRTDRGTGWITLPASGGCGATGIEAEVGVGLERADGEGIGPLGEFALVAEVGAVEEGRDQPGAADGEGAVAVSLVVTSRGCAEDVWMGGLAKQEIHR